MAQSIRHEAESSKRILVKPRKGPKNESAARLAALEKLDGKANGRVVKTFASIGDLQIIELPPQANIEEVLARYRNSGLVEYVEVDAPIAAFATTPNDTYFTNQWAIKNTGQSNGVLNADIGATAAWDIRTSASNIIVAVVDTGVRYTHEDLSANMWINPGEIPNNGIDDDGDGYVDNVYGIKVVGSSISGDPNDDNGHGTHVSGIIGAVGNNGKGISGVAWQVQLMACKFLGSNGSGNTSDAITCIDFPRSKGAHIINASWGGSVYSQGLYDAIESARDAGIIVVAAAGNESLNNDQSFLYPQNYRLDNIVVVAATDNSDGLAYYSCFGNGSVALGAPGDWIYSTYKGSDSDYKFLRGTSMAAPQVTGAFALLRSQVATNNYLKVIQALLGNVETLPSLNGTSVTGGRVNLYKALAWSQLSEPPNNCFSNSPIITGLSASQFGFNTGASKESGEPNHAGNSGGHSIWWTWVAPKSGPVTVWTGPSTFDTLLGIYTGTAVGSLTEVTSNDDSGYAAEGATNSQVSFAAVAGTTYRISVDGKGGGTGSTRLNLKYAPANDSFTNAYRISTEFVGLSGSSRGATKEMGEGNHVGVAGGRSVWWTWVAPSSGRVCLTTAGSGFDTLLAIYTGNTLGSLSIVATNDNYSGDGYGGKSSSVVFDAIANTTYHIAVDGVNGDQGEIKLTGGYQYGITDLGAVASGVRMNDFGQIAGYTNTGSSSWYTLAARWTNGNWVTLGASANSTANGINAVGKICGGNGYPFMWEEGTGYAELFHETGYAQAINDRNEVVGVYSIPSLSGGTNRAFYWTGSGGKIALGTFGGDHSYASDINNEGVMVGYADNSNGISRAFIWATNVTMQDIGGLALRNIARPTYAYSVSKSAAITGYSLYNSLSHCFLWHGGIIEDLGTLVAGYSIGNKVTDSGYVLGGGGSFTSYSVVPDTHGFIWPRSQLVDLQYLIPTNLAGVSIGGAYDMNSSGTILAGGSLYGAFHGFLLTNVSKLKMLNCVALTNGNFSFDVAGPDGTCQIHSSSDLLTWSSLTNVAISNGLASFVDSTAAAVSNRYYRCSVGTNYSVNAVGFVSCVITQGFSLISNPLFAKDNRIASLFAGVPQVTNCYRYNRLSNGFDGNLSTTTILHGQRQLKITSAAGWFSVFVILSVSNNGPPPSVERSLWRR